MIKCTKYKQKLGNKCRKKSIIKCCLKETPVESYFFTNKTKKLLPTNCIR